MTKLDELLNEYAANHQNKTNKAIHTVAVPVIFVCTFGLLWALPFFPGAHPLINWASIASIIVLFYYYRLSKRLALAFLFIVMAILGATKMIYEIYPNFFMLLLILFVIAWIMQFIGHRIEGKRPSFLRDLQFLLIGPLWVLKK